MTPAQYKAFLASLPELRAAGVTRIKWGDLEVDLTTVPESGHTVLEGAGDPAGAPQSDAGRSESGAQQEKAPAEDLDLAHLD